MAGKVNLYMLIKRIHFFSAAVVGVFLLYVFLTGYLLTSHKWFDDEEKESKVREEQIGTTGITGREELAAYFQKALDLGGKWEVLGSPGNRNLEILYVTPRQRHLLKYDPGTETAVIETKGHNSYDVLTVLHRMHGYGGGNILYKLYLFMSDTASLSLLVFVITGAFLWLKLLKRKIWGIVILVLGCSYAAWVILTLVL